MPTAVKRQLGEAPFLVSGWHCAWETTPPLGQFTGSVICTNGSSTIKAVYLQRK